MKPKAPVERLLRIDEVTELVGLQRSTLYALVARSRFPAPVKATAKSSRWREIEVAAWQQARIAERNATQSTAGGAP